MTFGPRSSSQAERSTRIACPMGRRRSSRASSASGRKTLVPSGSWRRGSWARPKSTRRPFRSHREGRKWPMRSTPAFEIGPHVSALGAAVIAISHPQASSCEDPGALTLPTTPRACIRFQAGWQTRRRPPPLSGEEPSLVFFSQGCRQAAALVCGVPACVMSRGAGRGDLRQHGGRRARGPLRSPCQ